MAWPRLEQADKKLVLSFNTLADMKDQLTTTNATVRDSFCEHAMMLAGIKNSLAGQTKAMTKIEEHCTNMVEF